MVYRKKGLMRDPSPNAPFTFIILFYRPKNENIRIMGIATKAIK